MTQINTHTSPRYFIKFYTMHRHRRTKSPFLSYKNFKNNLQDLKAEAVQFWDGKPWLKFHPGIENCVSAMCLCVLEVVLSASKTNLLW